MGEPIRTKKRQVRWKRQARHMTGSCGENLEEGAEEIRSFEFSRKEIFSNYDETKSKEMKRKKNGSKKSATYSG